MQSGLHAELRKSYIHLLEHKSINCVSFDSTTFSNKRKLKLYHLWVIWLLIWLAIYNVRDTGRANCKVFFFCFWLYQFLFHKIMLFSGLGRFASTKKIMRNWHTMVSKIRIHSTTTVSKYICHLDFVLFFILYKNNNTLFVIITK